MMTLKQASQIEPGDRIFEFGQVYHVWYTHYKVYLGVKGKRPRSFYPDQQVIIDLGYVGSLGNLPKIESELAFQSKLCSLWTAS